MYILCHFNLLFKKK